MKLKSIIVMTLVLAGQLLVTGAMAEISDAGYRLERQHLATFDDLDYNVFSNQNRSLGERCHG